MSLVESQFFGFGLLHFELSRAPSAALSPLQVVHMAWRVIRLSQVHAVTAHAQTLSCKHHLLGVLTGVVVDCARVFEVLVRRVLVEVMRQDRTFILGHLSFQLLNQIVTLHSGNRLFELRLVDYLLGISRDFI